MANIYLRYISLPSTVRDGTIKDEARNYNIYVNNRLTYEANQQTLQHEISSLPRSFKIILILPHSRKQAVSLDIIAGRDRHAPGSCKGSGTYF